MNLPQFAQQFPRALVARVRRLDGDLDDLVAALIGARVQDALVAQPEALPVFGALWNLEQRAAVDGRDFDLRPERRLPDGHRHLNFDVVTLAMEEGMLLH